MSLARSTWNQQSRSRAQRSRLIDPACCSERRASGQNKTYGGSFLRLPAAGIIVRFAGSTFRHPGEPWNPVRIATAGQASPALAGHPKQTPSRSMTHEDDRNIGNPYVKTAFYFAANVVLGNLILLITVSSSWFLSSLLLHFKLIFHCLFSVLLVASLYFLKRFAGRFIGLFARIGLCFLFTLAPVLLTSWFVIGYAFSVFDDWPNKLFFTLEFGGIMAATGGAFYWFPFTWFNLLFLRTKKAGQHQPAGNE